MATSKSKKKTAKKSSPKPKTDDTVKSEATTTKSSAVESTKQDTANTSKATTTPTTNTKSEEKKSDTKAETSTQSTKATVTTVKSAKKNPFKGFFSRKFDANENILTVFHNPKFYGALIGELIGTMLVSITLLTLGIYQPLYVLFAMLAITLAVFNLSGANLNPIITVGMMATRRMSAIRGILYIVMQIVGAWLGLLIVNAFRLAGDSAVELPVMTEMGDNFWIFTMIEFVGAIIIAFFFARALSYKRSAFTFAAVVAFGAITAILFSIIVSGNFLSFQNNFIHNPAIAFMYQIFPTAAADLGELIGGICIALVTYAIIPMIGGVIGFYVSDVAQQLSAGELE